MQTTVSKNVMVGLGFVLTMVSGVVLSKTGRPFNTLIFTIHKLVAVGTVILIGTHIVNLAKPAGLGGPFLALIVATGLFFLALMVSGAFLSFDRPAPRAFLRVHQIMPLLAAAASALGILLLTNNRS